MNNRFPVSRMTADVPGEDARRSTVLTALLCLGAVLARNPTLAQMQPINGTAQEQPSPAMPDQQETATPPTTNGSNDMGTMDMGPKPAATSSADAKPKQSDAAAPVQHKTATTPAATGTNDMGAMDMGPKPAANASADAKPKKGMDMGAMQGGRAPPGARDPNAYANGYEYGTMAGMEKADRLAVNKFLTDQLEYVRSHEGNGIAWDIHDFYGVDFQKLLMRTEGAVVNGNTDFTTGAEALWWRALTPFWGTVLGVHQQFGPGSHTSLAFGIEGLAPYWFELEATGYVSNDGRLWARLKGTYDVLLTNRLILSPEAETNLFSRGNPERGIGAGVVNIELGMRLRYEFSRKFAPYIGFSWDRAVGGSADERRAEGTGEPVSNAQFVTGLRMLW